MIRNSTPEDALKIVNIYNYYILNSIVSFEESPLSESEMWSRIQEVTGQGFPWIMAEEGQNFIGYAYAFAWRTRAAYRRTVETTVYLDRAYFGMGYGKALYSRLLEILKEAGYHTAIGGIALPNAASVRLHERLGFVKVAHYKEIGFKFDKWIDVGFWQKFL